ncbi:MAG: DUF615 domain-containing protein [Polynucleobacter sp.]|jgi:ribosome-associated protein|nr:DUF615 domain-containing protein [Polynucleobacter sp.]
MAYGSKHLDKDDQGPSKSELKRQMTQLQKLAEVLCTLNRAQLKVFPLSESTLDAIIETASIKSFEGQRRHKQYLGKLMRALTAEELATINQGLRLIDNPITKKLLKKIN